MRGLLVVSVLAVLGVSPECRPIPSRSTSAVGPAPLVDEFLIDQLSGDARLTLHEPEPWELVPLRRRHQGIL